MLQFTGGPNSGILASIKQYIYTSGPSTIKLNRPLPALPLVGDAFNILPGCNKLQATCRTKYVNIANYLGFDYVPAPEAAF